MKQIIMILIIVPFLSGCNYFRTSSELPNTQAFDLEQVKKEIKPLSLQEPYLPTEAISDYFNFYDLNPTNAQHFFGSVKSKGHTLVAHIFLPQHPRGTLFPLHGYFDHTGTLSKLIAEGLANEFAVVTWDLPGHGLSSGNRTETGDFDLCAKQFIDIMARAEPVLPKPLNLIAHSTGCSIALEYVYDRKTNAFDQIIFLAPLIQHEHWGWAKFGYTISKPFTNQVRRRDKKNSSDEAYLAFVKQDPLHSSTLSYEYLEDLYAWEKTLDEYPVWPGTITVIQGEDDDIVNWDHNLEFLNRKIQHLQVYMIPGGKHQLANERPELRDQAFKLIFEAIGP